MCVFTFCAHTGLICCMHTDLLQPHPAAVAPLQTPSLQRRAPDHRHRLHLFHCAPVRAQNATHMGGRALDSHCALVPPPPPSRPLLSFLLLASLLPAPSASSMLAPAGGLLASCFCQLERRRARPFPFSWLCFSAAAGTEGRIRCCACSGRPSTSSTSLYTHFKNTSPRSSSAAHTCGLLISQLVTAPRGFNNKHQIQNPQSLCVIQVPLTASPGHLASVSKSKAKCFTFSPPGVLSSLYLCSYLPHS